ncbi:extracellular solute-binding protein, partial [Candidatus Dependentiae bacterium]|nr:extracellular solute-binding protein [Candidatus Dependentiae bacterium]
PEKPPKTWEEFKSYCIILKKELNKDNPEETIYPFSFAPSIWFITTMYLQNQGVIYDKNTKAIIQDKEIMIKAIDFFVQLHKDDLMELTKDRSYQEHFIQGKAVMILASCVSRTFMKDDIKFNSGLTPFPQGKIKASILSGTNLIVFKSKNKSKTAAAVKLINYLLKPENVAKWVMETNYLPCRKSALTVPFFDAHLKENPSLRELYKEIDYLQEEPKAKKWVNGRKILRSKLEKIFFLNVPINEALDEFYKELK